MWGMDRHVVSVALASQLDPDTRSSIWNMFETNMRALCVFQLLLCVHRTHGPSTDMFTHPLGGIRHLRGWSCSILRLVSSWFVLQTQMSW